jgi:hypothetical protein
MRVLITLRVSGLDAGPYNFSSNINYSVIINPEPVPLSTGFQHEIEVPEGTTIVRVSSTGTCTNYVDVVLPIPPTTTSTTSAPPQACGITAIAEEIPDVVTACGTWSSYYFDRESYFSGEIDLSSSLVYGEWIDDTQSQIYVASYTTVMLATEITGLFGDIYLYINNYTNIASFQTLVGWQGENNPHPVGAIRFVGTLVTNLRTRLVDFTSYYDTYSEGGTPQDFYPSSSASECE